MDVCGAVEWLTAGLDKLLSTELVSAFFGALIGGLFTMAATNRSHNLDSKAAADERKAEAEAQDLERKQALYNTCQLILVEITTAWQVYSEEFATDLLQLPDGEPYVTVFPLGDNPFPVFDSAPACLAQLPPTTSALIVRFYMRAKGLISMVKMNNSDSERALDHARAELTKLHDKLADTGTPAEVMDQRLLGLFDSEAQRVAHLTGMGSTADGMKGLTHELGTLVEELKQLLGGVPKA